VRQHDAACQIVSAELWDHVRAIRGEKRACYPCHETGGLIPGVRRVVKSGVRWGGNPGPRHFLSGFVRCASAAGASSTCTGQASSAAAFQKCHRSPFKVPAARNARSAGHAIEGTLTRRDENINHLNVDGNSEGTGISRMVRGSNVLLRVDALPLHGPCNP